MVVLSTAAGVVRRLRGETAVEGRGPAALLAVVVVGAALRFYRLGAESIWLDEALAYSHATDLTLWELVVWLPQRDPNPPLYYILLRGWTGLVGTSPSALRALSALLGIASVVAVYLLARRLFDGRVGLFAATILAVSPYHVRFGQEARMYTLMVLATLVSFLFLVRLREEGGRGNAAGYVLATTVLVYAHTYGLFVVIAQAGYLLSARLLPDSEVDATAMRRCWLPVGAAVGLLTAPWTALLAVRVFGPTGTTGGVETGNAATAVTAPHPGVESLGSTYLVYWMPVEAFLTGFDAVALVAFLGTAVAGVGAALAVLARPRVTATGATDEGGLAMRSWRDVVASSRLRLLGWWAVVPVVVPLALSYLVTPIFLHRYTIAASLACYLLAAVGLARIRRRHVRYAALAVVLVGLVATLPTYYAADQKEQWEEVTAYVEGNADAGDLVVVSTDSTVLSYDYHASRSDLDVDAVPEDATRATIAERTGGEDTVWFVSSHLADRHEQRFQSVLDEEYELTRTEAFNGVVVYRYEATTTDATG